MGELERVGEVLDRCRGRCRVPEPDSALDGSEFIFYCGNRKLDPDWTIQEAGIQRNDTLRLTARLLSSASSESSKQLQHLEELCQGRCPALRSKKLLSYLHDCWSHESTDGPLTAPTRDGNQRCLPSSRLPVTPDNPHLQWAQRAIDAQAPKRLRFLYERLLHTPGSGQQLAVLEAATMALASSAVRFAKDPTCAPQMALLVLVDLADAFLDTDLDARLSEQARQAVDAALKSQREWDGRAAAVPKEAAAMERSCAILAARATEVLLRLLQGEVLQRINRVHAALLRGQPITGIIPTAAALTLCEALSLLLQALPPHPRLVNARSAHTPSSGAAAFTSGKANGSGSGSGSSRSTFRGGGQGAVADEVNAMTSAEVAVAAEVNAMCSAVRCLAQMISGAISDKTPMYGIRAMPLAMDEQANRVAVAQCVMPLQWAHVLSNVLEAQEAALDACYIGYIDSYRACTPGGAARAVLGGAWAALTSVLASSATADALKMWLQALNGSEPVGPTYDFLCQPRTLAALTAEGRWEVLRAFAYPLEDVIPLQFGRPGVQLIAVRSNLLESSFEQLMSMTPREVASLHRVQFYGEPGQGSGVLREWLGLLAAQLFDPQRSLFHRCETQPLAVAPSPVAARVQPRHLKYFEFAGRVLALSLLHEVPLGVNLAPHVWKVLAHNSSTVVVVVLRPDLTLTVADMQAVDETKARSYQLLLDQAGADQLGLTFSPYTHLVLGESVEIPLALHSASTPVTDANKHEYVGEMLRAQLLGTVEWELDALRKGLLQPFRGQPVLHLVTQEELNSALAGSQHISVSDWCTHTQLRGWGTLHADAGQAQAPRTVQWLWQYLHQQPQEQRARMLHFWTGLRHLPADGFAGLPVLPSLVRMEHSGGEDGPVQMPRAQTCFLQLSLPDYPTERQLRHALDLAMANAEGYGEA